MTEKTVLARPAIVLKDVACGYEDQVVFADVNLRLEAGRFAGLIGPSGAGKTTLLKLLLGLNEPWDGTVTVLDQPVRGRSVPGVGYIPQVETVDWNFPVTVEEVVLMGRAREMGWRPWPSREDRALAAALLDRLGLGQVSRSHIRELSGGQQQRVFLARALIGSPRLLLLDEPVAGADIATLHEILHLLAELNREGVTILLTTHDLNAVAAHLPWIICFNEGVVAEGPPERVFTPEVLRRTYQADVEVIRHGEFLLMAKSTPFLPGGGGRPGVARSG